MISLNDYLFSGNTVLKILIRYSTDLSPEYLHTEATTSETAHPSVIRTYTEAR